MATQYPPIEQVFNVYGTLIMERMNIGGVRLGNRWFKRGALPSYCVMINEVLPRSPEDMELFCKCKLKPDAFMLAVFDRYDVIEKVWSQP